MAKNYNKEEVMKRLSQFMKQNGITQKEMAEDLEITASYMSRTFKIGDRTLSMEKIHRICEIYNINENWLLTGEGSANGFDTEDAMLISRFNQVKDKLPKPVKRLADKFLKDCQTFTDKEWAALEVIAERILKEK